jgi:hypothetical protein
MPPVLHFRMPRLPSPAYVPMRRPPGDVIGAGTRGRQLGQNVSRACATPRQRLPLRLPPLRLAALPAGEQAPLAATPGPPGFNHQLIGINIAAFAPVGGPALSPEHAVDSTFSWIGPSLGSPYLDAPPQVGSRHPALAQGRFTEYPFPFGRKAALFGPGATTSANGPRLSQIRRDLQCLCQVPGGAASQVSVSNYVIGPTIRQNPIRHPGRRYHQDGERPHADAGVR